MNRYKVRFQTADSRVWEVTVKADGVSDDGYLVKFWRRWGPFGLLRYKAHYISVETLVSVICEGEA